MDWEKLFTMQKQLDHYIETNQGVSGQHLFQEKILALQVEIGELANETRCFKFWSQKPQSEDHVILAEYVDGLHFIMSLGLDQGYHYESRDIGANPLTATEQFNRVFTATVNFQREATAGNYEKLFVHYLTLGAKLGFSEQAIYQAYQEKNEINYERQDEGY